MKIKVVVTYDGTNYCGWQRQSKGVSVQGVLEDAVFAVTGEKVKVIGSGRTDAGVHAEGQVAHFSVANSTLPPEKFVNALNIVLPEDVKIRESSKVSDTFDASRSAKKKTYRYRFYKSRTFLPLKERYALCIPENTDVLKMREAAAAFVGERDFACFKKSGSGAKTTVRTIYSATVEEKDGEVYFTVTGNGFLYNMVRCMAGALLLAGAGKVTAEEIAEAMKKNDRTVCGKTLPAKGLTLTSVEYDG